MIDGWQLEKVAVVNKAPLSRLFADSEFELQLIHTASGTLLYSENVHLMVVAHGDPVKKVWGARIPAFETNGLHISIVDKDGGVVFEQGVDREAN